MVILKNEDNFMRGNFIFDQVKILQGHKENKSKLCKGTIYENKKKLTLLRINHKYENYVPREKKQQSYKYF